MALLAAGLLYEIWGRVGKRWPNYSWAGLIPTVLVVALTAAYAFAFTSIYTHTQTRVAASEWIYANIPENTPVLNEHWDDPIPLNLPGMPGSGAYPGGQIAMYDDDNPEKLATLMQQLRDNDWIFVTSNRLYDSINRIPERWPMANEYYRMLFNGELGFDLVHTETNYPSLFGIELNDDSSEESFTVYDHPKVLIFQKNDSFDADKVQAQLAATLSGDFVRVKSVDAGKNMLLMSDEERAIQQAGGTWSEIFHRDSIMNQHPVMTWYLALQLMALAAIPLCWRALNRLPDRGYAVAKSVGLAGATIFAWLLASLHIVDWGRPGVAIGIIIVAMLSVLASAGNWRQIWVDLRFSWRWVLAAELIFLAAFLVFVYFRSVNPDLWHPARGGEKPMEFAYFNAIIKSTHFPAYDPWFAGGYINYYYFGWVLFAAVTHLTGIVPGSVVQSRGGDRLRAGDPELVGVRVVGNLVLLALPADGVGLEADRLWVARLALRLRHRQSGHGAPDRHRPDGIRSGETTPACWGSAPLAISCAASGARQPTGACRRWTPSGRRPASSTGP